MYKDIEVIIDHNPRHIHLAIWSPFDEARQFQPKKKKKRPPLSLLPAPEKEAPDPGPQPMDDGHGWLPSGNCYSLLWKMDENGPLT